MAAQEKGGADKAPPPQATVKVLVAKGRTVGIAPNEYREGQEVEVMSSAVKRLVADGFVTEKKP